MVTPKGGWGYINSFSKDPEFLPSSTSERDTALGVVHSGSSSLPSSGRREFRNLGTRSFRKTRGVLLKEGNWYITFITRRRCDRLRDLGCSGTRNGHFGAFGPINVAAAAAAAGSVIAADTSC